MNPHEDYLEKIESMSADKKLEDYYLWPATPIGGDHQSAIAARVGAADIQLENPHSRPAMIGRMLEQLIRAGLLPEDFTLVDIACGDAWVIGLLHRRFPAALIAGVDCHKGKFNSHEALMQEGIRLYRGYMQHMYSSRPAVKFDVSCFLNTYRGWESAMLRPGEASLPADTDRWIAENSRFTFLTATARQVRLLRKKFPVVAILGGGEDKSFMCCIAAEKVKFPRSRMASWWSFGCAAMRHKLRRIGESRKLRRLLGLTGS